MVEGRTAEQTLRTLLETHVERLRARGTPEAQQEFFAGEIGELVTRYDLLTRKVVGFPEQRIDIRVLEDLDPVQQALVHYLAGQQYILTNGIAVPYAAPTDSGKAQMFAYVHTHHPATAQRLMEEELQKREREATVLGERGELFWETLGYRLDGYCEDRRDAKAAGRAFAEKTEAQLGEELIERAARKAEEWRNAIADPIANGELLGTVLDPMGTEGIYDEPSSIHRTRATSRERIRDRVLRIAGFDRSMPIQNEGNLFGRVQPVSLYAITDQYRLMPEEQLTTIARLAQ